MSFRLITAPASCAEQLLDRARKQVVAAVSEDRLLIGYIDAAVGKLDGATGYLQRCVLEQTWAWDVDGFPADGKPLHLPLPPCQGDADWTVDSVVYFDADGDPVTLIAGADYVAPAGRGFVVPAIGGAWPETADWPGAVTVTITSGSAAVEDLPDTVIAAIMLMVGDLFKNRETTVEGTITSRVQMSTTVENLLAGLVYTRPDV